MVNGHGINDKTINMIGPIVQIILGILLWKIIPSWIEYGSKKTRETIKLICNIVGIIIVLAGCYSLIKSLGVPI